jgi:hypothetical protein
MELHHRTASDPRLNMKQLFRGITLAIWVEAAAKIVRMAS